MIDNQTGEKKNLELISIDFFEVEQKKAAGKMWMGKFIDYKSEWMKEKAFFITLACLFETRWRQIVCDNKDAGKSKFNSAKSFINGLTFAF